MWPRQTTLVGLCLAVIGLKGRELVLTLERDDAAAVRVVGGGNGLLHGHPTVTRLEMGSLVLEASPRHPARALSMIAFGPMLLLLGLGVATRERLSP